VLAARAEVLEAQAELSRVMTAIYSPASPLSLEIPVEHCEADAYQVDDSVLIDFPERDYSSAPMAVWDSARVIGWADNTRPCDQAAIYALLDGRRLMYISPLSNTGGIPRWRRLIEISDAAARGELTVEYSYRAGGLPDGEWISTDIPNYYNPWYPNATEYRLLTPLDGIQTFMVSIFDANHFMALENGALDDKPDDLVYANLFPYACIVLDREYEANEDRLLHVNYKLKIYNADKSINIGFENKPDDAYLTLKTTARVHPAYIPYGSLGSKVIGPPLDIHK
jgi:hypothetical protein